MLSTGMASMVEGHQRPASISTCLSVPPYDHYYYYAKRATKTTLLYSNRLRSQREPASNGSKLRISLLILYPQYDNLIFRILRYHIRAIRALHGFGTISSSATGIPLICTTKALAGALLIRATLAFGSGASASGITLLCFRPRFALFAVASFASGVALLCFRLRFPLLLAS